MANSSDTPRVTERHIQTIGGAVIIALVLWVGDSVSNNTAALAKLSERSSNQTIQIKEMKQTLSIANMNRYTRDDASRDMGIVGRRIEALDKRIATLEGK